MPAGLRVHEGVFYNGDGDSGCREIRRRLKAAPPSRAYRWVAACHASPVRTAHASAAAAVEAAPGDPDATRLATRKRHRDIRTSDNELPPSPGGPKGPSGG